MKMISREDYEARREAFREDFLFALDASAFRMCDQLHVSSKHGGAIDDDLPELFRCIDAQLLRVLYRAGIEIDAEA